MPGAAHLLVLHFTLRKPSASARLCLYPGTWHLAGRQDLLSALVSTAISMGATVSMYYVNLGFSMVWVPWHS
jgi:hypothetical protein